MSDHHTNIQILKDCPFCGSNHLGYNLQLYNQNSETISFTAAIFCKKCSCVGPSVKSVEYLKTPFIKKYLKKDISLKEKAVAKWNQRDLKDLQDCSQKSTFSDEDINEIITEMLNS